MPAHRNVNTETCGGRLRKHDAEVSVVYLFLYLDSDKAARLSLGEGCGAGNLQSPERCSPHHAGQHAVRDRPRCPPGSPAKSEGVVPFSLGTCVSGLGWL